jgi:hypothetical protein
MAEYQQRGLRLLQTEIEGRYATVSLSAREIHQRDQRHESQVEN